MVSTPSNSKGATYEWSTLEMRLVYLEMSPRVEQVIVRTKTIKFTNGYCIDFDEKWEDKKGHFEQIVITCQKIEFESVVFENDWA